MKLHEINIVNDNNNIWLANTKGLLIHCLGDNNENGKIELFFDPDDSDIIDLEEE